MGITVVNDEGKEVTVTPEQLLPIPPRRGGRGRKMIPGGIKKVVRKFVLVDWDEVERMEARGEVVTPANFPVQGSSLPKPTTPTGGSFKW